MNIKNYKDVTKEWLENAKPNSHKVRKRQYYVHDGIKYKVDGKNVVLDYSEKESEVAKWLSVTFGSVVFLLPRINYPKGIETADYIWRNEYWDLKTMSENAISETRAVDNVIKTAKNQACNIILDITSTNLSSDNIKQQVKKLYSNKGREWLDVVMIIDNYKLVKVYKRKNKRN